MKFGSIYISIQNNHQVNISSTHFTRLKDDLGIDSIDKINLANTLENEFDIYISEDTIRKWKTVNDIIDTVYYCT